MNTCLPGNIKFMVFAGGVYTNKIHFLLELYCFLLICLRTVEDLQGYKSCSYQTVADFESK